MGSNRFYRKSFTLAQKRYMFCLMCNIETEEFTYQFNAVYKFIEKYVKTKHEAYAFCREYLIDKHHNSYELVNSITNKELNALVEDFFNTEYFNTFSKVRVENANLVLEKIAQNYHAFVYNRNPPLKQIASISWTEIIWFYWKWWSL